MMKSTVKLAEAIKRILAIAFLLQLLISSVCVAFEPPTDKRWRWIGSTDEIGCWVDTETMSYHFGDAYPHKGHKQVAVWVLLYMAEKDTSYKHNCTYDLACRQMRMNITASYDANDNLIEVSDWRKLGVATFKTIIPESYGEEIFNVCKEAW